MQDNTQKILKSNSTYRFINQLEILELLPKQNYNLDWDGFGNCFLEEAGSFILPDKVYDIDADLRKMIKLSFEDEDKNLGVLLTGQKGQGKSLNAKLLCQEMNLPIIMLSKSIPNDIDFISFLKQIRQDFVLYSDEFEKLFAKTKKEGEDDHSQETFLSFMDGTSANNNKILFLLTTNEEVNTYMLNRPSRVKWLKAYNELDQQIFDLIVEDLLKNKEFKEDLVESTSLLNLNIDLLVSIIKDVNRFNKPFSEFAGVYNYIREDYSYEVYKKTEKKPNWELIGIEESARKITKKDRGMLGYSVSELVSFESKEIIFKHQDWIEEEFINEKGEKEEREFYETCYIRLIPSKTNIKHKMAF